MKDVAYWDEAAKTWRPRNQSDSIPEFYFNASGQGGYCKSDNPLLSASKTNGFMLVRPSPAEVVVYRLDLQGGVPRTALATGISCCPSKDSKAFRLEEDSPNSCCVSPDGKYRYLSGPCSA